MPAKGSKLQPDGTWLVPDAAVDQAEEALLAEAEAEAEGGICPECFPQGWPEGATNAGCVHGQWVRSPGADSE